MSKSKLKKCLRNLKLQNGKLEEIKYVNRLLRKKLRSHVQRNYEEELSKDFWKFCKKEFEESETQEPNFDESSSMIILEIFSSKSIKTEHSTFPLG